MSPGKRGDTDWLARVEDLTGEAIEDANYYTYRVAKDGPERAIIFPRRGGEAHALSKHKALYTAWTTGTHSAVIAAGGQGTVKLISDKGDQECMRFIKSRHPVLDSLKTFELRFPVGMKDRHPDWVGSRVQFRVDGADSDFDPTTAALVLFRDGAQIDSLTLDIYNQRAVGRKRKARGNTEARTFKEFLSYILYLKHQSKK